MNKKQKRRRRPLHKASEIPSDIVQPSWAWSHLLTGYAILLLSYVALLGGFSDGVVVAKNLFTGDFWAFQEIYNDIFIRGLSPDGVRTGVAPSYFPDMVLWFALATVFSPDVVWFLCGFLLHAFGAAGWVLVCRRLGAGPLVQGAVPLAYAVQILLLAYGENELFLPAIVLLPIHSGTWAGVPWLLWTCLGYSRAKVRLLFGLLTLIAASDLAIVPWFVAPTFLTIILQWWRKDIPSRPAVIWLVILTAATSLGYVIHLTLGPFEKGLNTGKFLTLRLEDLIASLMTFAALYGGVGAIVLASGTDLDFVFRSLDSHRMDCLLPVEQWYAVFCRYICRCIRRCHAIRDDWHGIGEFPRCHYCPLLVRFRMPLYVSRPVFSPFCWLAFARSAFRMVGKDQAPTSSLAAGFSGDYRYGLGGDQNLAFRLPAVRAFPNTLCGLPARYRQSPGMDGRY